MQASVACVLRCDVPEIELLCGLKGLNTGSWGTDSRSADWTDLLASLGAAGVASISRTSRLSTPRSFIPRSLTVPSLALTVLASSSSPSSSMSITSGSRVILRGARVEAPPGVSLAPRLSGLSRRWTVRSVVKCGGEAGSEAEGVDEAEAIGCKGAEESSGYKVVCDVSSLVCGAGEQCGGEMGWLCDDIGRASTVEGLEGGLRGSAAGAEEWLAGGTVIETWGEVVVEEVGGRAARGVEAVNCVARREGDTSDRDGGMEL